jgi:D-aspartate ligase
MIKKGIIVLGGHVQALGIIRILGKLGIPAIIIDKTEKNIARHSKYCIKSFRVEDSGMLDFLLNLSIKKEYSGWLIFPTNDFHVKILSQNKEALENDYIVTTDKWAVVKQFYNKIETYQLAKMLSIPIANTYFPEDESGLEEIHPIFPCIIKPAVMHNFYSQTKKKVFVCKNREELTSNYKKAISIIPANEIIVQDIIPGPSRNQFSACFLFLNGESYVSLTACRMRQHPIDFGNATTYAETVDLPILKEYAKKILKAANYNGLCEVEFKKDENDGEYKFLEVNTRTWKWHAIAEKTETPFLESYYNYLTGEKIESINHQSFASFRHILTDVPIQIKMVLKGYNYAFRLKRPKVRAVLDWKDIKPFIFEKFYLLHFLLHRL